MWIYQHPEWPNFTWNAERLASQLADLRYRQGRLLGKMEGLGFDFKREANLVTLTNDVVKSSAIEGEILNPMEVRSSIARRLGMNIAGLVHAGRNVEGVVEMMLDATQSFLKPLTATRLFAWHAALFPTGRSGMHAIVVGNWRGDEHGPMQVVSGPIGHEKVHFKAPSADKLEKEMKAFLAWFEKKSDIDPILKVGITHFWFETVHPFEDGNGRIGRAIADMALARAENMSDRFYSLSSQFAAERKDYYKQLEKQSRSTPEITGWLEWFLDCLGRAISSAEETLAKVLFKAKLWEKINQNAIYVRGSVSERNSENDRRSINERQRLIINRMLEDDFEGLDNDFKGHMNSSKYAKLAKCSTDTALRDIQDLKNRKIFVQNPGGGRSTSYRLTDEVM